MSIVWVVVVFLLAGVMTAYLYHVYMQSHLVYTCA